jgi:hypothetical protein
MSILVALGPLSWLAYRAARDFRLLSDGGRKMWLRTEISAGQTPEKNP